VKPFSGVLVRVSVVAFERDSILEGICGSGFRGFHPLLLFCAKRVSVSASLLLKVDLDENGSKDWAILESVFRTGDGEADNEESGGGASCVKQ
jgi:hypothetical protein